MSSRVDCEALIKDDAATLTLWRDAVTDAQGRPSVKHDNVIVLPEHENSRSYTLSRLKREAPALFDRVVAGKLSANAAAIEAGFRKKPTPYEQVVKLLPKLPPVLSNIGLRAKALVSSRLRCWRRLCWFVQAREGG